MLSEYRTLPTSFVRDIIMKAPSKDMMNTLARSVLTLYSYDDLADDISLPNVLRQCLQDVYKRQVISCFVNAPGNNSSNVNILKSSGVFTRIT